MSTVEEAVPMKPVRVESPPARKVLEACKGAPATRRPLENVEEAVETRPEARVASPPKSAVEEACKGAPATVRPFENVLEA